MKEKAVGLVGVRVTSMTDAAQKIVRLQTIEMLVVCAYAHVQNLVIGLVYDVQQLWTSTFIVKLEDASAIIKCNETNPFR